MVKLQLETYNKIRLINISEGSEHIVRDAAERSEVKERLKKIVAEAEAERRRQRLKAKEKLRVARKKANVLKRMPLESIKE